MNSTEVRRCRVDSKLSDKKLHSILDKLNPELRSTEEVDGKRRVREFYAMTAEDAYSILEAIAEINGYSDRLKKWKATETEQREEALAQEIDEQHRERLAPFTFSKCGIAIGEQVEFYCNGNPHSGELCEVVDDKHVKYNGETWSLSGLARRPMVVPEGMRCARGVFFPAISTTSSEAIWRYSSLLCCFSLE